MQYRSAATGSLDHNGGRMEKKEIRRYVVIIAAIFLISALIPAAIGAVTDMLVGQIQMGQVDEAQSEESEEAGKMSVTLPDLAKGQLNSGSVEETETSELPSAEKEIISDTEDSYERELEAYRKHMQPELSETKKGAAADFVGERKQQFFTAVADYIFSLYGDSLSVTKIDVIELVKDNETELVYQIEVFATDGSKEYSEQFISSYNREWDFYSIYSYSVE